MLNIDNVLSVPLLLSPLLADEQGRLTQDKKVVSSAQSKIRALQSHKENIQMKSKVMLTNASHMVTYGTFPKMGLG